MKKFTIYLDNIVVVSFKAANFSGFTAYLVKFTNDRYEEVAIFKTDNIIGITIEEE